MHLQEYIYLNNLALQNLETITPLMKIVFFAKKSESVIFEPLGSLYMMHKIRKI